MSVQDIVKYVRQTPGNTNPSVIASMVNAEMNSTLEEAKRYTDSQRLAHTETKVITWDGVIGDKLKVYLDGMNADFVKISDVPIDLEKETPIKVTFTGVDGNTTRTLMRDSLQVEPDKSMGILTFFLLGEMDGGAAAFAVSLFGDIMLEDGTTWEKGLYFNYHNSGYTSALELETVHQIDKKFIPGVTLPVINYEDYFSIDFTTAFMQGLSTYQGKAFRLNNVANTEILQNFTPETPAAIVKIPMTMEGQSGTLYTIAEAMCSESIPLQMHFSGSFYTGSIYEYDVWLDFGGNTIFRFAPQEVEYIAET